MMMVLEAHKQQQLQEQEREQELRTAAAAGTTIAAGARASDAGTVADARQHGVQHTSVNRFFAAADETVSAAAAGGIPGRRSMEDAASAARGMQRSSYGSMEDNSR
jgi:hypothetical protein